MDSDILDYWTSFPNMIALLFDSLLNVFTESTDETIYVPLCSSIPGTTGTCCELPVGFGEGETEHQKCLICFGERRRHHSCMLQFLIVVRESGDEEDRLENGGLYSPV
jgi:hypothetical protein